MPTQPSETEVLGWYETLSNWGRWGDDDQRGTLNLITPTVRRRAAELVRTGIRVSCSWNLVPDEQSGQMKRMMRFTGEGLADPERVRRPSIPFHDSVGDRMSWASEYIGLMNHGERLTHVKALSRMFWDGRMYNGRPAALVTAACGALANDVVAAADQGIFTRGVLIDVPALRGVDWLEPGDAVYPEDLEEAEARFGFRVGEGDTVLLRTGFDRRRRHNGTSFPQITDGRPGYHVTCLPWLHEREVAVIGCDAAQEVLPSGFEVMPLPVHLLGIAAMGLWLIDSCDLDTLATTCGHQERWEFLFTCDPLRLVGATGSPVNAMATF